MTESQLKKKILKKLKEKFPTSVWYKIHGGAHQERGLPDILGCYKGMFYGIEIKVPGKENTVTKYQQFQLDRIKEAGGKITIATSVETLINFILKNS